MLLKWFLQQIKNCASGNIKIVLQEYDTSDSYGWKFVFIYMENK